MFLQIFTAIYSTGEKGGFSLEAEVEQAVTVKIILETIGSSYNVIIFVLFS